MNKILNSVLPIVFFLGSVIAAIYLHEFLVIYLTVIGFGFYTVGTLEEIKEKLDKGME